MEEKILSFNNSEVFRNLAGKYANEGNYVKALNFLFTALENCKDKLDILADIAQIYSDMDLFDLSNKYWFKFLDKAPKIDKGLAYEELLSNYFYLEKIWIAGYYFQCKLEQDGKLDKLNIDEDIINFFSEQSSLVEKKKRKQYYTVYPLEKADYSHIEETASQSMLLGDRITAVQMLLTIPPEKRTEKIVQDIACACYFTGDIDTIIKVCLQSLNCFGDNITALSYLSIAYKMKNNNEKSEFYYRKALSLIKSKEYIEHKKAKNFKEDAYKIFSCAIEHCDYQVINEYANIVISDRPYDANMYYFYAINCLNMGNYDKAVELFAYICKIEPDNLLFLEMLKLSKDFANGKIQIGQYLPFDYIKEFPKKLCQKYKTMADKMLLGDKNGKVVVLNNKKLQMLCGGVIYGDSKTSESCAHVLASCNTGAVKEQLRNMLLMPEIPLDIKRLFIYSLIIGKTREKIGVVANDIYKKAKLSKLSFENKVFGKMFFSAYAVAYAWALTWNISKPFKVASVSEKTYNLFHLDMLNNGLSPDEITAVIMYRCNFPEIKDKNVICYVLGIEKSRIEKYINTNNDDKGETNG